MNFETAAKKVENNSKKINITDKGILYGYYKQATVGDINISKPLINPLEIGKWDAWNKCKGLSKIKAKEEYVKKVTSLGL